MKSTRCGEKNQNMTGLRIRFFQEDDKSSMRYIAECPGPCAVHSYSFMTHSTWNLNKTREHVSLSVINAVFKTKEYQAMLSGF